MIPSKELQTIKYIAQTMIQTIDLMLLFSTEEDQTIINLSPIKKLYIIKFLYQKILQEVEKDKPNILYINAITYQINSLSNKITQLSSMN
jgi:hypothetical protein